MIAAFDTCGPWVCVALGEQGTLRAHVKSPARLNHNEILPHVYGGMEPPHALSALAVNQGPGTFTGTRVGVAFAAGLAQSLGVRVYSVSSLMVAASLAPVNALRIRILLPLVREVWGVGTLVRRDGSWQEESCEEVPEAQLARLDHFDRLISPWAPWPNAQEAPPDWNPADTVLKLAFAASQEEFKAPRSLTVRYLGKSQAERVFEARYGG